MAISLLCRVYLFLVRSFFTFFSRSLFFMSNNTIPLFYFFLSLHCHLRKHVVSKKTITYHEFAIKECKTYWKRLIENILNFVCHMTCLQHLILLLRLSVQLFISLDSTYQTRDQTRPLVPLMGVPVSFLDCQLYKSIRRLAHCYWNHVHRYRLLSVIQESVSLLF